MTIYLRTQENKTLLEIEVWVKTEDNYSFVELSVVVNIKNYSDFLLSNLDKQDAIVDDFQDMSELRGWLWEVYFMSKDNVPSEIHGVVKELNEYLQSIAQYYGLALITD